MLVAFVEVTEAWRILEQNLGLLLLYSILSQWCGFTEVSLPLRETLSNVTQDHQHLTF